MKIMNLAVLLRTRLHLTALRPLILPQVCESVREKMISVGGFGIGSSVVLSILVFALVAELFYFLWWKRKIAELEVDDGDGGKCGKIIFRLLRWKNSSSSTSRALNYSNESALEQGIYSNDSHEKIVDEESVESELKRVHNLTIPPRFLLTIEEETKEDMAEAEAEDGKSRGERRRKGSRSRSLRDALMAVEPHVLTPLSSSPLKASTLNPLQLHELHRLNPLFETDSELYSFKSSPPPTFKFLRDAEDKFFRKLTEGTRRSSAAESPTMVS